MFRIGIGKSERDRCGFAIVFINLVPQLDIFLSSLSFVPITEPTKL
jgi:biopolymer transport protein ExbD